MNRWVFFLLWLVTIFAGAFGAEFVPENCVYITGFIAGTFSFMFLRLFGDKRSLLIFYKKYVIIITENKKGMVF